MTTITHYKGIVRSGQIELPDETKLPEGSHVVVILTGPDQLVEESVARRRANRWLIEDVSNMLAADEGRLLETEGGPIWRFGVYITGRGRGLLGPVGHIDLDALSGALILNEHQVDRLIVNAQALTRSVLSSE